MLDDAVAAVRESDDSTWHTARWRDVQMRAAASSAMPQSPETSVQLRAPLLDLQVRSDDCRSRGSIRQLLETIVSPLCFQLNV